MLIQKGLVKYKDRSDIICTYGITDDGKQYYFLDGNRLPNGNIIATTALVEAIDPVAISSSIGVIDVNGKVIIPFENKAIKLIADGILLVEKAKPTTDSVLEAIKLRRDPLAATRLVTTPATIKDKINGKMGAEGKFVFNDQFSEATIFDVNGNNLIDNNYFSFIGINKEKIFFSKNTIDSDISEYIFKMSNIGVSDTGKSMDAVRLNIENTGVSRENIEEAINKQIEQSIDNGEVDSKSADDSTHSDVDASKSDDVVLNPTVNTDSVQNEDVSENNEINKSDLVTDVDFTNNDNIEEEESLEQELNDVSNDLKLDIVDDTEGDINSDVVSNNTINEFESSNSNIDLDVDSNNNDFTDEGNTEFNLFDNLSSSSINNNDDGDVSFDSVMKDDNIFSDTDYIDDYKEDYSSISNSSVKDTIIEDVAVTMSNLIKLNRNQKHKLEKCEINISQLKVTNKKIIQGAKNQAREIESLKSRVKNYETIVAKLEARNQILDNKVHEQERVIAVQNDELNNLRPQVEGKKDLVRLLEDAQSLFTTSDKDDSYNSSIVA